jgi:hypothetical protein
VLAAAPKRFPETAIAVVSACVLLWSADVPSVHEGLITAFAATYVEAAIAALRKAQTAAPLEITRRQTRKHEALR